MNILVEVLAKEGEAFKYLNHFFHKLSDAKLKD